MKPMTIGDQEKPLPCFVCGKQLESVFAEHAPTQPGDAVIFSTYGQYGSTVFDPQDNSQILVNICDPCLLERKDRVWHLRYVRQEAQEIFSRPWDPGWTAEEDTP